MKNITIISTILFASSISFAILPHNMPMPPGTKPTGVTVKCEYFVTENNQAGNDNGGFKFGEPLAIKSAQEVNTTDTEGFVLKGKIKQVCAMSVGKPKPGTPGASGGLKCTDNYNLTVALDFGKSGISSFSEISVSKADKNKRLNVNLIVGNRQATANCDVQ